MMKKNSLQGKIREFDKKEHIREKSGNFTRETKKYENLGCKYFIFCLNYIVYYSILVFSILLRKLLQFEKLRNWSPDVSRTHQIAFIYKKCWELVGNIL
jgi:IS4 transposase